jgi:transposase
MGRKVGIINSTLFEEAKLDLKKIGSLCIVATRLQAIISAKKHGIKKVCEVLDLNRSTINEWMNSYKDSGVEGLMKEKKASRAKLTDEERNHLKDWIESNPTSTLKELVFRFDSELNIKIGKSSVHRELKNMGFSHITGRKKHYKSDPIKQDEFKKKLKMHVSESKKKVYFFDESRFGTHSKIGLAWFKKGSRTRIPCRLGFKSFYLYSAASGSGEEFTLIADSVNKPTMQIFLDEFSKTLKEDIILVMDNAGWHKALNVPKNIEIIFLPPYSPELNPVERLWKYIKDHTLKNKIYKDLDELEVVIGSFITSMEKSVIASICNCNYIGL